MSSLPMSCSSAPCSSCEQRASSPTPSSSASASVSRATRVACPRPSRSWNCSIEIRPSSAASCVSSAPRPARRRAPRGGCAAGPAAPRAARRRRRPRRASRAPSDSASSSRDAIERLQQVVDDVVAEAGDGASRQSRSAVARMIAVCGMALADPPRQPDAVLARHRRVAQARCRLGSRSIAVRARPRRVPASRDLDSRTNRSTT